MHPLPSGRRVLPGAALALCALVAACPPPSTPPSTSTLVRLDDEPAGAHCPSGGTAIRLGPDSNHNGSLEDSEVIESQTRYVCAAPTAPSPALVEVLPEPPGPHCRHGGSVVRSGLDGNRDGVLDASEVTSSQFVCDAFSESAIHFGNVQVLSSADLEQLDGIEYLVGDLFIRGDLVPDVHLPHLQRITGTLSAGWEGSVPLGDGGTPPPLESLRLPALRSVGNLLLTLPSARTLDLASLESVGDSVELTTLGQLTAVDLPALRSTGGDFLFHYNVHFDAAPQSLRAPRLSSVSGELVLDFNTQLVSVELPSLARVRHLSVKGNASLPSLALPALEHAGAVTVSENAVLASAELPRLGGGEGATLLTSNPSLSECTALALEVQRRRAGYLGAVLREDNRADASCAANTASSCVGFTLAGGPPTYAVCYAARDFSQAATDCASVFPGGHLAVLETQAEHLRLRDAVSAGLAVPANVWLGSSDRDTEGSFQWLTGGASYSPQAGDASFWAPGQPDDAGGSDCVMVTGLTGAAGGFVPGSASDEMCERRLPALCEIP